MECEKASFFLVGAPKLVLYTDSSWIVGVLTKDISETRIVTLLRMSETILCYNIEPHYIKEEINSVADYLNRPPGL